MQDLFDRFSKRPYPISLYIHIPFCIKKCDYCDFHSISTFTPLKINRMISEILNQLSFFLEHLHSITIDTIYIGGGTPSLLPGKCLNFFLQQLISKIPNNLKEFTIEANPESISDSFLDICNKNKISRLSLGIQTLNRNLLKILGRHNPQNSTLKALSLIKSEWKKDLNIDLITGIPNQNFKDIENDIYTILKFCEPTHFSLYSLTIEPETPLYNLIDRSIIKVDPPNIQNSLWLKSYNLLEKLSFSNYEISNFAKINKESLHNLCYWELKPYLGIGPSAVSTLPIEENMVVRINNPSDNNSYLSGEKNSWSIKYELINDKEFLFETMMMGLRLKRGINKQKFYKRFGISISDIIPDLWLKWQSLNLIEESKEAYILNKKGRFILNNLLLELYERLDSQNNLEINKKWP